MNKAKKEKKKTFTSAYKAMIKEITEVDIHYNPIYTEKKKKK